MRVGILSSWASRAGGGVFEAIVAHAKMLRERGLDPTVISLHDEHAEIDRHRFGRTPVQLVATRGPRQVGYAPELTRTLIQAELDVLHLHGIWMYPSASASRWASITQKPYVISPHGMLDPWILNRGRLKKFIARSMYERRNWHKASMFHALNRSEAGSIAAATGRTEVATIPNMIDIPVSVGCRESARHFLYLGRIHQKKNLGALLAAWPTFSLSYPGAQLTIAGWGEAEDVTELEAKVTGIAGSGVKFVGPVFGAKKATLLNDTDVLVLPSLSEGLPVAVLEAWAQGIPVLMSPACNLGQGYAAGAALDCGVTEHSVLHALRIIASLPPDRYKQMAHAARRLVESEFSPLVVGRAWVQIYGDLTEKAVMVGASLK